MSPARFMARNVDQTQATGRHAIDAERIAMQQRASSYRQQPAYCYEPIVAPPTQDPMRCLTQQMAGINIQQYYHISQGPDGYHLEHAQSTGPQRPSAMPPQPPPPHVWSRGGIPKDLSHGYAPVESRSVFVGKLPHKAREKDVKSKFAKVGTIKKCTMKTNSRGQAKSAIITYESTTGAGKAIEAFHKTDWMGQELEVRSDTNKETVQPPATAGSSRSSSSSDEPTIVDGSGGAGGGGH